MTSSTHHHGDEDDGDQSDTSLDVSDDISVTDDTPNVNELRSSSSDYGHPSGSVTSHDSSSSPVQDRSSVAYSSSKDNCHMHLTDDQIRSNNNDIQVDDKRSTDLARQQNNS